MKYLILGSCVTRDAFEHNIGLKNNITNYHARTSLATLDIENLRKNISRLNYSKIDNINSNFQKKMVENDFNNKTIESIKNNNFDKIIIDLIDERFDLVEIDGKIVTKSSEFKATKIFESKLIDTYSDEFFNLWKNGFNNLLNVINSHSNPNKILINKVFWSNKINYNLPICEKKYPQDFILKNNMKLKRMYNYLEKRIDEKNFINYEENTFYSNPNHKWGLSPFHYIDKYYEELIENILNT